MSGEEPEVPTLISTVSSEEVKRKLQETTSHAVGDSDESEDEPEEYVETNPTQICFNEFYRKRELPKLSLGGYTYPYETYLNYKIINIHSCFFDNPKMKYHRDKHTRALYFSDLERLFRFVITSSFSTDKPLVTGFTMKIDQKTGAPIISLVTEVWDDLRIKLNEICRHTCGSGLRWTYADEEIQPNAFRSYGEILIHRDLEHANTPEGRELFKKVYDGLVQAATSWVDPKCEKDFYIDGIRMETYYGRFFLVFYTDSTSGELEKAFNDIPEDIREYLDFIYL